MKLFWGCLIFANLVSFVAFNVDRCGCGGPSLSESLLSFGPWAGLFAVIFALLSIPVGLTWRAIHRRWGVWRPLSVPKLILASALVGSCVYEVVDHKLTTADDAEMAGNVGSR